MPTTPVKVPVIKEDRFEWQKLQYVFETPMDHIHRYGTPEQLKEQMLIEATEKILEGVKPYIEGFEEDYGRYYRMIVYVAKRK